MTEQSATDLAGQPAGRPALVPRIAEWALALGLLVMQLVNLRIGLTGRPAIWSLFLIGFSALTLVTLPWLLRPTARSRGGNLALVSFLVLLAWALWSATRTPLPRMFRPQVAIERVYLVVPVVTAIVTTTAAWGLAAVFPPHRRQDVLWRAAAVVAVTTLVAGPRTMLATHSARLGTGMGGAAIYHVVLLLAGAVLLAGALRNQHRVWSLTGSLLCLGGLLVTGSRAGLFTLLVFLVLLGAVFGARGRARLVLGLGVALSVVLLVLLATVPTLRRLLQPGEQMRLANYRTALRAWQASGHDLVFGVGSGRMWPWYYFEASGAPIPWRGTTDTGFGRSLTNPHSLYLGVLAELGLVGAALLLVVVGVVLALAIGAVRRAVAGGDELSLAGAVVPLALVASLVAFAVDHYLLKNFAVSFWWWLVLALSLGRRNDTEEVTP